VVPDLAKYVSAPDQTPGWVVVSAESCPCRGALAGCALRARRDIARRHAVVSALPNLGRDRPLGDRRALGL
jgi:hypothetical protein